MPGWNIQMHNYVRTCSNWIYYCFLLLVVSAVMKIEAMDHLSIRDQVNQHQQNNAFNLYRQHQMAMAKANLTTSKPQKSEPVNCAKGGAKRYPDSNDDNRFHMCTFNAAHHIWMVYSFNCPKQTIFDNTSQKCVSKAVASLPSKKVSWDQRVQQSLQQKYHNNNQPNAKNRPVTQPANNPSSSSTSSSTGSINDEATTEKSDSSLSQSQSMLLRSQYYKNRYQTKVQHTTPSSLNKFNSYQYNRVRPGHVTQVNRRYTTPTTRTPFRRTTFRTITTTTTTTTTSTTPSPRVEASTTPEPEIEVASSSMEDVSSLHLNSDLNSNSTVVGTEVQAPESTTKISNFGMIRTVAGKIAYLAHAIEILLTEFESSMDKKGCVENKGNAIGKTKVNADVDADVKDRPEEPVTQLVPSDFNILDFFTARNPSVNTEIVNKIITMPSTSGIVHPSANLNTNVSPNPMAVAIDSAVPISIPTSSSTTNEQNDPEEKHDNTDNSQQTATLVDSSSEEEELNEEEAALRLPSPSKEFDLEPPQSSSPIIEDTDAQAETTTSVHQVIGSENQIQQTEQNEKGEAGESMEPAEWNIIVKKPTETPLRTSTLNQIQLQGESSTVSTSTDPVIDDSSVFSSVDDIPPEQTSDVKLSPKFAHDDKTFPFNLRFPVALSLHTSQSAVSNEQADILKTGSNGSNRRPRRQRHQKVAEGEESDF